MTSRRRRSRFNPSLTLKNSGNTARDHLASERTFLAYVRTSLAMASAGVGVFHFFLCTSMPMTTCAWIALVQLFKVSEMSVTPGNDFRSIRKFAHPLGAATVLFGLIILLFGMVRYFMVQVALPKGLFPAARSLVVGVTFILAVLITITFGVLLSERQPK
ncbi:hypothetical protein K443DRAFT_110357 [Laccaria amethystina LaAM-08-1]|uniref:Unplaced genomic scaffold K443scaffold_256, whole genome shotgun sequence n=1 Tax=Laccaria amethystina LaAM-08-1 TaxID=1095629 RepID=A0A0C9XEB7_9AGAR|nr:hypothetical protein K443DRAFT_110357 [Laccaria amethystina LaAM-08-1]